MAMAEHPWDVPANEALEIDLPPEPAHQNAEGVHIFVLPWDGTAEAGQISDDKDRSEETPPPAKKQRKPQSKGKPRGSVIKALKESSITPATLLHTYQNVAGPATGPEWLEPLLVASAKKDFFALCRKHTTNGSSQSRMTDCNLYCLECLDILCTQCENDHAKGHKILQIRKSSGYDCVRAGDLKTLLDMRGVQNYSINKALIIYLDERPMANPSMGRYSNKRGPKCNICNRHLVDEVQFCSIGCKRKYINDPGVEQAGLSLQPLVS